MKSYREWPNSKKRCWHFLDGGRANLVVGFAAVSLLLLPSPAVAATVNVTTFHNDNFRSGQNLQEVVLTPANVNSTNFGKLFTMSVDSVVDAQPLYLSGVSIPGQGVHNVVYVVTENDSVYAFDADAGTKLWQVSTLESGESPSDARSCSQVTPTTGITSTPVIDLSAGVHGTIYAVAMSKDSSGNYFQRVHALDVTSGQEEFGGPVLVQAQFPSHGPNSQNGFVTFDASQYEDRAGLLLLNHVIYTGWSSHCDHAPYNGWLIGYNDNTLTRVSVLNVTPNGTDGAIWQSGGGLAAAGSNIFFLDANGTFETTLNAHGFPNMGDFGNAFLKISTANNKLAVSDYFNMHNTVSESNSDQDLGSGGAMLLPPMKDSSGVTRNLAIGAGKDANIYIVDRSNMGKFNPNNDDAIYQKIDGALGGGEWAVPAYFNGNVYFGPEGNRLFHFQFSKARLSTGPVSESSASFAYPGTSPSVSANGSKSAIVWAIEHSSPSVLHAYDAASLGSELYNSNQAAGGRDQFGSATHFGTPTIANGKVYVGTTNSVAVFGILGGK